MLVDQHPGRDPGGVEAVQEVLDVVAELGQLPTSVVTI